jgi:hypothetical protein
MKCLLALKSLCCLPTIALLTQQLGGTMKEENDNGTHIFFEFKLAKAA